MELILLLQMYTFSMKTYLHVNSFLTYLSTFIYKPIKGFKL